MRSVRSDRAVFGVLALPLAVLVLAGGLLSVAALDGTQDLRRTRSLASAVPDLIRLQQAVAAERATAVKLLVTDRPASEARGTRSTTNAAMTRAAGAMRSLRGNPRPASAAEVAAALKTVRHAVDTGNATAGTARMGYDAVTEVLAALPAAVAASTGEDRLAGPTAALAARLRAADAAAGAQLAGDRLLWAGRAAGRAEFDEMAGRLAVLDRAVTDLATADVAVTDATMRADLARLRGGAVVRSGIAAWDASGTRLVAALQRDARATADDLGARSAGLIRVHVLLGLAAVFGTLAVVAAGLASGVRLSRRMSQDVAAAAVRGAGEPYATSAQRLGWDPGADAPGPLGAFFGPAPARPPRVRPGSRWWRPGPARRIPPAPTPAPARAGLVPFAAPAGAFHYGAPPQDAADVARPALPTLPAQSTPPGRRAPAAGQGLGKSTV